MIIRLASLLLGVCLLVSGCTFGHLTDNTEMSDRHASVRWAFVPGSQMVYFLFLPLPGRSEESYFNDFSIGKDYLIFDEEPYGDHTGHALASKRHILSLKDGSPRVFGQAAEDLHRVSMDWEEGNERCIGLLPDGRVLVERFRPWSVWIGWDPEHLTRLASSVSIDPSYGMYSVYSGDGTMVLAFSSLVLCIDPARLPAPPPAPPAVSIADRGFFPAEGHWKSGDPADSIFRELSQVPGPRSDDGGPIQMEYQRIDGPRDWYIGLIVERDPSLTRMLAFQWDAKRRRMARRVALPADPNWPPIELQSYAVRVTTCPMNRRRSGGPLYVCVEVSNRSDQGDKQGLVWALDREGGVARPLCHTVLALRTDKEKCDLYINTDDVDGDGWLDLRLRGEIYPAKGRWKWLGAISRVLLYDPASRSLRLSPGLDKGVTPARKTEVHLTPPAGKTPQLPDPH